MAAGELTLYDNAYIATGSYFPSNFLCVPSHYLRNLTEVVFSVELQVDPVQYGGKIPGKLAHTSTQNTVRMTYKFDLGSMQSQFFSRGAIRQKI